MHRYDGKKSLATTGVILCCKLASLLFNWSPLTQKIDHFYMDNYIVLTTKTKVNHIKAIFTRKEDCSSFENTYAWTCWAPSLVHPLVIYLCMPTASHISISLHFVQLSFTAGEHKTIIHTSNWTIQHIHSPCLDCWHQLCWKVVVQELGCDLAHMPSAIASFHPCKMRESLLKHDCNIMMLCVIKKTLYRPIQKLQCCYNNVTSMQQDCWPATLA